MAKVVVGFVAVELDQVLQQERVELQVKCGRLEQERDAAVQERDELKDELAVTNGLVAAYRDLYGPLPPEYRRRNQGRFDW